ncbi:hypothetical protein GC207_11795 [bacterium]|nr:hypothetical protein [bacterium]
MKWREWSSFLVKTAAIAGIVLTESFTNALAQVELGPPTSTKFWPGTIRAADWLPGTETAIVVSIHGVHLWDPTAKKITKTFSLGNIGIVDTAISSDGSTLFTLTADGDLRQWDVATATVTHEVEVQPGYESRIALARDVDLVAVPSTITGQIDLRKKSDLTLIRTLPTGHGDAGAVTLSADGSTLAATFGTSSVVAYNVGTGETLWEGAKQHYEPYFLSPNGSKLYMGETQIGLPSGTRSTIPNANGQQIVGLNVDGLITCLLRPQTTNAPAAIHTVRLPSGNSLWTNEIGQHFTFVNAFGTGLMKFSPDDQSLLTSDWNQILTLNALTGEVRSREFAPGPSCALSSDGSKLAQAYGDGFIRTWDVATEQDDLDITGTSPLVGHLDLLYANPSRNEFLISELSGNSSPETRRYDFATGELLQTYPYAGLLAFIDHGTKIHVNTINSTIDLTTGEMGPEFGGPSGSDGSITSLGADQAGDRIALVHHLRVDVYNAADGSLISSTPTENRGASGIPVFSPDGSEMFILESTFSGVIGEQIDVDSGRTIRTYSGLMSHPYTSAWSSDNRLLAFSRLVPGPVTDLPLTTIVDPRTGTTLAQISDVASFVSTLRFSSDNRTLVMVTQAGEVRQYDLSDLISLRGDESNTGKLTLKWDETEPNATYSIQESSDVAPAGWQSTTTNQSGQTEITIDPNVPAKFFRLKRTE